jgi:signal transduction histidine kinase
MELRPPMLDDLGLVPTLTWFLREYENAASGVKLQRDFNIREQDVPEPLKITLFRILQEATSNIIKHADATRVRICLNRRDEVLHLMIEDNGRGFEPDNLACPEPSGRGLGLLSMKERASHSSGIYRIESAPGKGTSIQIWWPCEPVA